MVGDYIEPIKMKMKMERQKAYIAMIVVQFVYAGLALFSKAAISKGINSFVFVVYRQALATLALAPFAFFCESGKAAPLSYSLLCKIFFTSLIGITASLNLYYVALNDTSATFAAATPCTIPAITFLMAAIFRMESISIGNVHGVGKVAGSVMSVSGALVFAYVKGPSFSFNSIFFYSTNASHRNDANDSHSHSIRGSLIMLAANTAWSLWIILQGVIVKQYPAKLRLTTLQCLFSCIQTAVFALFIETKPSSWKLGWDFNLLSVAYCGIVVTGLTYWIQLWAIVKKGPVFTAAFTPLALIITALFSAFLWKQSIFWGSVGGAILLAGGLYCVLWGKSKEDEMMTTDQIKQQSKEELV